MGRGWGGEEGTGMGGKWATERGWCSFFGICELPPSPLLIFFPRVARLRLRSDVPLATAPPRAWAPRRRARFAAVYFFFHASRLPHTRLVVMCSLRLAVASRRPFLNIYSPNIFPSQRSDFLALLFFPLLPLMHWF